METSNKQSGVGAAHTAATKTNAVESTAAAVTANDACSDSSAALSSSSCCADIAKALQKAQCSIAQRFGISPDAATLSTADSDDLADEDTQTPADAAADSSNDAVAATDVDSAAADAATSSASPETATAAASAEAATAASTASDSAVKALASSADTSHVESFEDDEALARLLLETIVYSDNKVGLCDETMELICKAIGAGDLGKLNWVYRLYESEQRAKLADDEVRNLKNHAQGLIMLAAMESRKAGVKHKHLVALSERLALAVELLQDADRISHMCYVIARAFTELVASHNRTLAKIEAAKQALAAATVEPDSLEQDTDARPRVITTLGYLNSEDCSAHSYEPKRSSAKSKADEAAAADASSSSAKKRTPNSAQGTESSDAKSAGAPADAESTDTSIAAAKSHAESAQGSAAKSSAAQNTDNSAAQDGKKAAPKTRRRTKDGVEPEVVIQARAYIEKHLYDDVFVGDIGAAVGCTKEHISRLFKRYHKVTLMEYVTAQRIRIAKDMLTSSDAKIKVIAQVLRFSSVAHFCNVFRDLEHATPTQWREEHMTYPNPGARPIPQHFPVDDDE